MMNACCSMNQPTYNPKARYFRFSLAGAVAVVCLLLPRAFADEPPAVDNQPVERQPVELATGELVQSLPGEGPLSESELTAWLADPANHHLLDPQLPIGLAAGAKEITGLERSPLTRAKIELGRQLFFDPRLSSNGSVSCATCHDPELGFAADTTVSFGIDQQPGTRNSPVTFNRLLGGPQFWDGRAASLEDQAIGPITSAVEMGNSHQACTECLTNISGYRLQFERIFPDGVTIENVGRAIASFERVLVTGPSAWDHYDRLASFEKVFADDLEFLDELEQDDPELFEEYMALRKASAAKPMSPAAIRGSQLFFSDQTNCSACHNGANFTDDLYHNIGIGMQADKPDWGRYAVTQADSDRGAFKTPTLRNVAQTGPYMHDGSLKTLAEVVAWYDQGGHENAWLDAEIEPLGLTDQEQADLVAFLKSLTGPLPKVERGRLPE